MSLELFVEKTTTKINEKWSKNWSWEVPGGARGPSRSLPGAGRDTFWDAAEILEEFEASRARPGANLGTQPGPAGIQKSTKNGLMAKKRPRGASPGAFFTDLLCRHRFRSIFCSKNVDFQRILDTFCDSKNYESRIQHTFFAQAANLENHRFL